MLSIYYKIWVDAIVFEQTKNGEEGIGKYLLFFQFQIFSRHFNLLTIFFAANGLTKKTIPIFFRYNHFNN